MGMKTALIIFEKVGAGHQRVATLIASMLAEQEDLRIVTIAGSELFEDPSVEWINRVWNGLIRMNRIGLADAIINFLVRAWIVPIMELMSTRSYHAKLDEVAPSLIICTADGFSKILGEYAKERGIPLYMINTEFTTFEDMVSPAATHLCYFEDTVNAIRSYSFDAAYFSTPLVRTSTLRERLRYVRQVFRQRRRAGGARSIYRNIDRQHTAANDARCHAIGPLVEPAYFTPCDGAEVRRRLGVSSERPCVLVISGSIGGKYIDAVVESFQSLAQTPVTLLCVCGRDERARRRLVARRERSLGREGLCEVIPLGYVDNMVELYAACDVVIARPSASVFIEAMMRRVPLIIPERATSNDQGGAVLLQRHGLGEVYRSEREMLRAFAGIIAARGAYVDAISRFLAPYPSTYDELRRAVLKILSHDSQSPSALTQPRESA